MSHWALKDLPQGWFNHAERALALIEEHQPKRCVEVGTWRGASAIATARVIRQRGGRLTCIDTFALGPLATYDLGPQGTYPAMHAECLENIRKAGQDDVIEVIVDESLAVARTWPERRLALLSDPTIDYCYIDADHTYDSVRADLAAWWPLVHIGGIIAGDDYLMPAYPGTTAAWDAFDLEVGGLQREGLVWRIKNGATLPWPLPTFIVSDRPMAVTACAVCHRAVLAAHVDGEGRCCHCGTPPPQRSDVARPADEPVSAPRPLDDPDPVERWR